MDDADRTASLMSPSKLAQVKPKSPGTPAAWLDQMAADAGHAHVRRLAELCQELRAQAGRVDYGPLTAQLDALAQALPRLDFGLLQPQGWWARATGKTRSAGAEFAATFDELEKKAKSLAGEVQALQKKQQEQAGPGDRSLVEFEVEFHAIDKIIEQGTRWLHDMRNQLKTRQSAAADEASHQQIRDDTARCEILVERLKGLRAAVSAAQQSHQQALGIAGRRAALMQTLAQMLRSDVKAWRSRLSTLASAAGGTGAPALNLDEPQEAHRELQLCVKQVASDCAQLQGHEKAFGESLDALDLRLKAVAAP
jgi:hypothetical protein